MRVLVTGASGFVGTALVRRLAAESAWIVRGCSRNAPAAMSAGVEWAVSPDLSPDADWVHALRDVDAVVHLAARVHVMAAHDEPSEIEFQRANVHGTIRLAEQAVACGVRRFVLLSSIKVNGEAGEVTAECSPAPVDAYGRSKWDAEQALTAIGHRTALEVVIIRPPLVYGPGVKANFQALLSSVRRGVPLPFGAISNRRSLVGVDNLVDLIAACLVHPAAASETFLVSDGEDLSTPDLVRRLAAASGVKARLVPVPVWCLRLLAALARRPAAIQRLTGSLFADISKTRRVLGWTPPYSVDEELWRTVRQD